MKKRSNQQMKINAKTLACIAWIIPLTLSGCGGDSTDSSSQLHLITTYKLAFGEPSGIAYDEKENVFSSMRESLDRAGELIGKKKN